MNVPFSRTPCAMDMRTPSVSALDTTSRMSLETTASVETTRLECSVLQVRKNLRITITMLGLSMHCVVSTPTSSCYEGEVRLENSTYTYYNGTSSYGGRVEVCYNDTFYPVCDEGWTDSDAAVACNNIGYSYYFRKLLKYILELVYSLLTYQVAKQQRVVNLVCPMSIPYFRA